MDNIDTNIDNYSIFDLLTIFNLTEPNEFQVRDAANNLIAKMKIEGKSKLISFIEEARDKIIDSLNENEDYNENEENNEQFDETTQLGNWWANLYPKQKDPEQNMKLTDRMNKVQTFNNEHFPMNRERLGVNQSVNLPVIQDTLNPRLQNTVNRIVCIDSQYRQNILPYVNSPTAPSYNTDYTLDLSDPLNNVLSIRLMSVQVPTSWYTFDHSLGNTFFICDGTVIDISDGNYSITQLVDVINNLLSSSNCDVSLNGPDPYSGKLSFTNKDLSDNAVIVFSSPEFDIESIDPSLNISKSCKVNPKINQNLGWNLGFRVSTDPNFFGIQLITIPPGETITAGSLPNVYGPQYFILVIDDFNNNHLNNGLVNIIDTTTKVGLPSYYNPLDMSCIDQTGLMVKTSPRTLTQAQLYSVNEIILNRKKGSYRTTGPTTTDVLAIIPLRDVTNIRPNPYIDNNATLLTNVRNYFGPVNIERLRVRLMDDKGNLVNLHDSDWSFSLVVEQLYQY